ncbi:hypothetical protein KM043_017872 [Ampulex compressa]|nr:hypothetical protein KM043_017872 [Ampulex compressa]
MAVGRRNAPMTSTTAIKQGAARFAPCGVEDKLGVSLRSTIRRFRRQPCMDTLNFDLIDPHSSNCIAACIVSICTGSVIANERMAGSALHFSKNKRSPMQLSGQRSTSVLVRVKSTNFIEKERDEKSSLVR